MAQMTHDDRERSIAAFARLSEAGQRVWGKHDRKTLEWLPLWRHMADSAAVAGRLWDVWIPTNVRELLTAALPGGWDDARRLVVWLAAAHDIGKATPAFACQVESRAEEMRAAGLAVPSQQVMGPDRRLAPHGLAGQLLIREWLRERQGWAGPACAQVGVIAGGHHGLPPGARELHVLGLHPELLRTRGISADTWKSVQFELLGACAATAGVEGRLADWRTIQLPQPVQVAITAVVIMADWIASATKLFPGFAAPTIPSPDVGVRDESRRLEAAWHGLDLPAAWTPAEPQGTETELFAARFDLPPGAAVRPVQVAVIRMAREMPPAGLLMIEAPMAEGKLEAALAAAEILAARTGAGGCLVALPTGAIASAVLPRLLDWLKHLESDGPKAMSFADARAALNDTWDGLLRNGERSIEAVDVDGSQTLSPPGAERSTSPSLFQAHQWLRGPKRALLAPVVLCGVDQVLFAGLKSKHLVLRHLALAGKVVVIDEVHIYDAQMNEYLHRVLEWLAAYGVPVIMLSTTLPPALRRSLAAAYAGAGESAAPAGGPNTSERAPEAVGEDSYPLITAVAPGHAALTSRPAAAAELTRDIAVEGFSEDLGSLAARLEKQLGCAGVALVVRATDERVLQTAGVLRERFGQGRVTVVHSGFLAADRSRCETELLARFGSGGQRPGGTHVVVVDESIVRSLDIDCDLLVTDLAPVDLLLQRIGKLHRYSFRRDSRPTPARCLVTGFDLTGDPPTSIGDTPEAHKSSSVLLRTLAVLRPHLRGRPLNLPADISRLVRAVYGEEPVGPPDWAPTLDAELHSDRLRRTERRERADVYRLAPPRQPGRAVVGWIDAGVGDAEDTRAGRAQVRGARERLDVLVVRRRKDGVLTTLPHLSDGRGGLELPETRPPDSAAAKAAGECLLTLPQVFSRGDALERTLGELRRMQVDAWQSWLCASLRGELLLVLDEDGHARLTDFDLDYSPTDGLRVTPLSSPSSVGALPSRTPVGTTGSCDTNTVTF